MNEEMPWMEKSIKSSGEGSIREYIKMDAKLSEIQEENRLVRALLETAKEIKVGQVWEANKKLEEGNEILKGVAESMKALIEELKKSA